MLANLQKNKKCTATANYLSKRKMSTPNFFYDYLFFVDDGIKAYSGSLANSFKRRSAYLLKTRHLMIASYPNNGDRYHYTRKEVFLRNEKETISLHLRPVVDKNETTRQKKAGLREKVAPSQKLAPKPPKTELVRTASVTPKSAITQPGQAPSGSHRSSKHLPKFFERHFDKNRLKRFVGWFTRKWGLKKTIRLLDHLKLLGFQYAQISGLSLNLDDLYIPPQKKLLLETNEKRFLNKEVKTFKHFYSSDLYAVEFISSWGIINRLLRTSFLDYFKTPVVFSNPSSLATSLDLAKDPCPPELSSWQAMASQKANLPPFLSMRQTVFRETEQTKEMKRGFGVANGPKDQLVSDSLYIMAFSGARGNMSQVGQLTLMRGLMADPLGNLVEFPILSNFKEGLTLTEYLVSCYGARKGIIDTGLRTAVAGDFTRRLVDVGHRVVIKMLDCWSTSGIYLQDLIAHNQTILSLEKRLLGRLLANNSKILPSYRNKEIFFDLLLPQLKNWASHFQTKDKESTLSNQVLIRSPLTCNLFTSSYQFYLCRKCYGWTTSGQLVDLQEAVGVLAAQSLGEPGTQLTLRTFHTGGVYTEVSHKVDLLVPFTGHLILPNYCAIKNCLNFHETSSTLVHWHQKYSHPYRYPQKPIVGEKRSGPSPVAKPSAPLLSTDNGLLLSLRKRWRLDFKSLMTSRDLVDILSSWTSLEAKQLRPVGLNSFLTVGNRNTSLKPFLKSFFYHPALQLSARSTYDVSLNHFEPGNFPEFIDSYLNYPSFTSYTPPISSSLTPLNSRPFTHATFTTQTNPPFSPNQNSSNHPVTSSYWLPRKVAWPWSMDAPSLPPKPNDLSFLFEKFYLPFVLSMITRKFAIRPLSGHCRLKAKDNPFPLTFLGSSLGSKNKLTNNCRQSIIKTLTKTLYPQSFFFKLIDFDQKQKEEVKLASATAADTFFKFISQLDSTVIPKATRTKKVFKSSILSKEAIAKEAIPTDRWSNDSLKSSDLITTSRVTKSKHGRASFRKKKKILFNPLGRRPFLSPYHLETSSLFPVKKNNHFSLPSTQTGSWPEIEETKETEFFSMPMSKFCQNWKFSISSIKVPAINFALPQLYFYHLFNPVLFSYHKEHLQAKFPWWQTREAIENFPFWQNLATSPFENKNHDPTLPSLLNDANWKTFFMGKTSMSPISFPWVSSKQANRTMQVPKVTLAASDARFSNPEKKFPSLMAKPFLQEKDKFPLSDGYHVIFSLSSLLTFGNYLISNFYGISSQLYRRNLKTLTIKRAKNLDKKFNRFFLKKNWTESISFNFKPMVVLKGGEQKNNFVLRELYFDEQKKPSLSANRRLATVSYSSLNEDFFSFYQFFFYTSFYSLLKSEVIHLEQNKKLELKTNTITFLSYHLSRYFIKQIKNVEILPLTLQSLYVRLKKLKKEFHHPNQVLTFLKNEKNTMNQMFQEDFQKTKEFHTQKKLLHTPALKNFLKKKEYLESPLSGPKETTLDPTTFSFNRLAEKTLNKKVSERPISPIVALRKELETVKKKKVYGNIDTSTEKFAYQTEAAFEVFLTVTPEGILRKNKVLVEFKKKKPKILKERQNYFIFSIPLPLSRGVFSQDIPVLLAPSSLETKLSSFFYYKLKTGFFSFSYYFYLLDENPSLRTVHAKKQLYPKQLTYAKRRENFSISDLSTVNKQNSDHQAMSKKTPFLKPPFFFKQATKSLQGTHLLKKNVKLPCLVTRFTMVHVFKATPNPWRGHLKKNAVHFLTDDLPNSHSMPYANKKNTPIYGRLFLQKLPFFVPFFFRSSAAPLMKNYFHVFFLFRLFKNKPTLNCWYRLNHFTFKKRVTTHDSSQKWYPTNGTKKQVVKRLASREHPWLKEKPKAFPLTILLKKSRINHLKTNSPSTVLLANHVVTHRWWPRKTLTGFVFIQNMYPFSLATPMILNQTKLAKVVTAKHATQSIRSPSGTVSKNKKTRVRVLLPPPNHAKKLPLMRFTMQNTVQFLLQTFPRLEKETSFTLLKHFRVKVSNYFRYLWFKHVRRQRSLLPEKFLARDSWSQQKKNSNFFPVMQGKILWYSSISAGSLKVTPSQRKPWSSHELSSSFTPISGLSKQGLAITPSFYHSSWSVTFCSHFSSFSWQKSGNHISRNRAKASLKIPFFADQGDLTFREIKQNPLPKKAKKFYVFNKINQPNTYFVHTFFSLPPWSSTGRSTPHLWKESASKESSFSPNPFRTQNKLTKKKTFMITNHYLIQNNFGWELFNGRKNRQGFVIPSHYLEFSSLGKKKKASLISWLAENRLSPINRRRTSILSVKKQMRSLLGFKNHRVIWQKQKNKNTTKLSSKNSSIISSDFTDAELPFKDLLPLNTDTYSLKNSKVGLPTLSWPNQKWTARPGTKMKQASFFGPLSSFYLLFTDEWPRQRYLFQPLSKRTIETPRLEKPRLLKPGLKKKPRILLANTFPAPLTKIEKMREGADAFISENFSMVFHYEPTPSKSTNRKRLSRDTHGVTTSRFFPFISSQNGWSRYYPATQKKSNALLRQTGAILGKFFYSSDFFAFTLEHSYHLPFLVMHGPTTKQLEKKTLRSLSPPRPFVKKKAPTGSAAITVETILPREGVIFHVFSHPLANHYQRKKSSPGGHAYPTLVSSRRFSKQRVHQGVPSRTPFEANGKTHRVAKHRSNVSLSIPPAVSFGLAFGSQQNLFLRYFYEIQSMLAKPNQWLPFTETTLRSSHRFFGNGQVALSPNTSLLVPQWPKNFFKKFWCQFINYPYKMLQNLKIDSEKTYRHTWDWQLFSSLSLKKAGLVRHHQHLSLEKTWYQHLEELESLRKLIPLSSSYYVRMTEFYLEPFLVLFLKKTSRLANFRWKTSPRYTFSQVKNPSSPFLLLNEKNYETVYSYQHVWQLIPLKFAMTMDNYNNSLANSKYNASHSSPYPQVKKLTYAFPSHGFSLVRPSKGIASPGLTNLQGKFFFKSSLSTITVNEKYFFTLVPSFSLIKTNVSTDQTIRQGVPLLKRYFDLTVNSFYHRLLRKTFEQFYTYSLRYLHLMNHEDFSLDNFDYVPPPGLFNKKSMAFHAKTEKTKTPGRSREFDTLPAVTGHAQPPRSKKVRVTPTDETNTIPLMAPLATLFSTTSRSIFKRQLKQNSLHRRITPKGLSLARFFTEKKKFSSFSDTMLAPNKKNAWFWFSQLFGKNTEGMAIPYGVYIKKQENPLPSEANLTNGKNGAWRRMKRDFPKTVREPFMHPFNFHDFSDDLQAKRDHRKYKKSLYPLDFSEKCLTSTLRWMSLKASLVKILQKIVNNIQTVYIEQGVDLNDQHIEVLVRQMGSKLQVNRNPYKSNGSKFFWNETISVSQLADFDRLGVDYSPLLRGITKVSLQSDSFLSAASFQSSMQILSEAALKFRSDFLLGLKENIIVSNILPNGTGGYFHDRKTETHEELMNISSEREEIEEFAAKPFKISSL